MRPVRGGQLAAAIAGCVLCAGCQQAQVLRPTPTPATTAGPTPARATYDRRYGNSPITAADALTMQRRLVGRGQYWEVSITTAPPIGATASSRGAASQLTVTIATESAPTIRALLAAGDPGQQAYCLRLLDEVRALGYSGLAGAHVEVYFTEDDHHADLTWTPQGAPSFRVLDNDLRGSDIGRLPAGTTPFPVPPTP